MLVGGLSRGVRGGQTRRPVGSGVSHLLTCYTIAPDLLDDHLYVLAVRVGAGSLCTKMILSFSARRAGPSSQTIVLSA